MSIPVDMKAAGIWLRIQSKPDESQGRKAMGPRFLREAMYDSSLVPKAAGLLI